MKFLRLLPLTLFAVLLLTPPPTQATGCKIVAPVRSSYVAPVQSYSAYSSSYYVAPLYSAIYSPSEGLNADLLAEFKLLRQELSGLREQIRLNSPQASLSPVEAQTTELFRRRCAECHTAGSEKGGLVLFDSPGAVTISELSPEVPGILAAMVGIDKMPPGANKLTPEEKGLVMQWVLEQRGKQPAGTGQPQRLPATMPPANGVKP